MSGRSRAGLLLAALALGGCGVSSSGQPSAIPTLPSSQWTTHPVDQPTRPTVAAFIGDSYTAGAMGNGVRWTDVTARRMKWQELNFARGGGGYVTAFYGRQSMSTCGQPRYCASFVQMGVVAARERPDVVVVAGGRNDPTPEVGAAAKQLFCQLKADLPRARVVVLSPLWDSSPYPATLVTMGSNIKASAQACGAQYVDVGPVLQGRRDLISSDGVHPNAKGYRVLGEAVAAKLARTR